MNADVVERTGNISLVKTTELGKPINSWIATYDQFRPRFPYFETKEHTETSLSPPSSGNPETAHLLTDNPVQQQDNTALPLDISVSGENPTTSIPLGSLSKTNGAILSILPIKTKSLPSEGTKY